VFDSGRSIRALLKSLKRKMRMNMPGTIRIACPWYKPGNNKTKLVPDYYLHETDQWIVFPHELSGLTLEEIKQGKTELEPVHDVFD
jgi:hypoxanthine phosphoribosyltransferase